MLAIHEHEVHQISFMNGLSSLFFSIGSGLLSFAVGLWANAAFQNGSSPEGRVLTSVGAPVALLFAVVAFGVGILAVKKRGSLLATIEAQSVNIPAPGN
ncbi:hypothetical protein FJ951_27010 [Mesorhizobium sp. B2-2-3]|uniref:hypothetical protein n=1 Tax=Mesorhizobium sp. B2-2-3 TaxID=2589963 RepID=UPI0011265580|nr:hypothetical protein [Mesorhizobium sp. B2-2-3]TPM39361.1 hypothetical protein FJ951_27010 [Mesorhizobium sp. B2-2-3]